MKNVLFDVRGNILGSVNFGTDLWYGDPNKQDEPRVSELNLCQLEGQVRASVRGIAAELKRLGKSQDWLAMGISATHHTAGRIDALGNPVRRAICWDDPTLREYRMLGEKRLGGKNKVCELLGGPWADRYSLSHLVKDEKTLSEADWKRTKRFAQHGVLVAGYLTGNFDVASISNAASTGIMNLHNCKWNKDLLGALANSDLRALAWKQLPKIVDYAVPVGTLAPSLKVEAQLPPECQPLVFPTSDDQEAGLVGGGAVQAGQMAIIFGTSVVVNSASATPHTLQNLDLMRLNWGPYLWMRCNSNGRRVLDSIVGKDPPWAKLEAGASKLLPGVNGLSLMPFALGEPSLGIAPGNQSWLGETPRTSLFERYRGCLEALCFVACVGFRTHESQMKEISQITVSGGIARSDLLCRILASVLGRPIKRLVSEEGSALGAAVEALAAIEKHHRQKNGIKEKFTMQDAVDHMVQFKDSVDPVPEWVKAYAPLVAQFQSRIKQLAKGGPLT